ncbi:MAG: TlyA family RNA methyltransferase [Rhodospirillales bacterium]|jgi:23S rRNA (cytidine1920-2'-O)/16S rRNA (cytidine1409-2'-O)-methyltransferase|nr:TlyA family RNA methyltransferase [Rhodospirillales bacterium]MDP6804949.1 TlyA family RNA methyltransferase [Rhodospirillales bacterium]
MSAKRRLDQLLVERGLADNPSRARALVMAGVVFVAGARAAKPGSQLAADAEITVRTKEYPWASRGGLKLAHALEHFALSPAGRIALDVGASTGGFTDVLIAHGATKVYAVDVGRAQLDWRLRQDSRVVVLEGVNARFLTRAEVPEAVGFITCDASFIGLETVLPAPMALSAPEAALIALIKPQFEVGRANVGKGGVVRDPALHAGACERIQSWLATRPGWRVLGVVESPIKGPKGNTEFLIAATRG